MSSSSAPARHGPRATARRGRPASGSASSATPVVSTPSSAAVRQRRRLPDRPRVGARRPTDRHAPRRDDERRPRARRLDVERGRRRRSRFVHAEGGPHLNGALATADLIDELNFTLSPLRRGRRRTAARRSAARTCSSAFDLAHLVVDEESFVFSRWVTAPSLLSSSISRWKSAATSKSLYTDANRR